MLVELLEKKLDAAPLEAIGHRLVHGGPSYHEPQRVDPAMLEELRRMEPFDPEHLPAEIALMEAFQAKYPNVPQIACSIRPFITTCRGLPGCCRFPVAMRRKD